MTFREGLPLYLQIAERLVDEILAGKYAIDERIPGVRDYSALLQVNVNTTTKAFDVLTQRGIIYNKRGLGSFVAADAHRIIKEERQREVFSTQLPNLAHTMQQLGISLSDITQQLQQLLYAANAV